MWDSWDRRKIHVKFCYVNVGTRDCVENLVEYGKTILKWMDGREIECERLDLADPHQDNNQLRSTPYWSLDTVKGEMLLVWSSCCEEGTALVDLARWLVHSSWLRVSRSELWLWEVVSHHPAEIEIRVARTQAKLVITTVSRQLS